jgi:leader peptidase (prepilin peptidase)/N-methyltransferase
LLLLLIAVSIVDIRERRIPNAINLTIAVSGVFWRVLRDFSVERLPVSLGYAVGEGVLMLIIMAGSARIIRAVREDARIGWGDIKFLAAAACWVGIEGGIAVLMLASLVIVVTSLALSPWQGLNVKRQMPFGPALALGLAFAFGKVALRFASL